MSANYLPNERNVSIFGGELHFQPDGAARSRLMGHIESFTWSLNVEVEEIWSAISGARTKIGERIKEVSAEMSMTLQEASAQNVAYATQGEMVELLQAAITGGAVNATNVVPGEVVDLGALNVSNVAITDGVSPLVDGVDYILNAEVGLITVYTAQAQFDVSFDAPEITSADGRTAINILENQSGISGVFHVIGKNADGKRYAARDLRAILKPSGDLQLLSDGSSFQKVELTGTGTMNPLTPNTPWGRIIPLN